MNPNNQPSSYSTYNIKIEGLSPIFIGSGEAYSQLDYIPEEDKIHIIDFDGLLKTIPFESIEDLTRDIDENFQNNIWNGDINEFLTKYDINWKNFISKTYELKGNVGKNKINQFIKAGNQLYIPGSSIKGAIRTAILFKICQENAEQLERILNNIIRYNNDRDIQGFIESNAKDDLLRALIVSDSHPHQNEEDIKILGTIVYHLRNMKKTVPIYNEVIYKGFENKFSLKINKSLINSDFLFNRFFKLNHSSIIGAINDFSKEIILYEIDQFNDQNDPNLNSLIAFYESLQNKLTNLEDNEAILRIGQGSSFIAITMFLLFKDNLDMMKRYAKLNVFNFDVPDRNNPNYAITYNEGYTILIDRNSEYRPQLNETWLCTVVSVKNRRKLKFVKLLEKVDKKLELGDIIYPVTRKFTLSNNHLNYPFGWVKLKWLDQGL